VQDVITGLFIQLENAVNVGDVIEAAGKTGVVEKLTIRSVSLRDVSGVYHVIPFSAVDAVSNHTKGFSYYVADVSVAYDADIDVAKAAMITAYDDLAASPVWSLKLVGGFEWFGINELGDSAVVLRARLKTMPGEQWGVGRAYIELVKRRFDSQSIEIPFPQMKLWVADPSVAPVPESSEAPTRQNREPGSPTDAD
jgi:small conductance mechanosensitive channel